MDIKIKDITEAGGNAPQLPMFDYVKAGFPSPATDYAGDRIDIVKEVVRHPNTTFYARISGDSMNDAGIFDGDIVVIDRSLEPRNGDYVVAYIDGEFTLKEFRLDTENDCAWLIPHNKAYSPIRVDKNEEFLIWGVMTHNIHPTRH